MSSFWKNYVLAYFMKNRKRYSYSELAKEIGLSLEHVDEIVNELVTEGKLAYNEENMLTLTETGRLQILNQKEEFVFEHSSDKRKIINPDNAWPLEKVYFPEKFLSKL